MKGNEQRIWFDGKLLATLTKAEAKLTLDWEERKYCGKYGTDYEYTGFKIDGTLTFDKIDSSLLKKVKAAIKNGNMPEFTVTGATATMQGKTERVNLTGVCISELKLFNAEAGKTVEEEIPFTARDYDVLEAI